MTIAETPTPTTGEAQATEAERPAVTVETAPPAQDEQLPALAIPPLEVGQRLDTDILANPQAYVHLQRVAKMYAACDFVPDHCKRNVANCAVIVRIANRLGVDEVFMMQRVYPTSKGKWGMEAQIPIGLANSRGIYRGGIQYKLEGEGDTRKCTAYGVRADTGDIESCECSIAMAKKAGWYGKDRSHWPLYPDHMLKLRSATWLIREHHPELLCGLETVEEIVDVNGVEVIRERPSQARVLEQSIEGGDND